MYMEPTAKNVPKIRTDLLRRLQLAERNWSQFPIGRLENYTPKARSEIIATESQGLADAVNIWVDPKWIDHLDSIRAQLDPADLTLTTDGLFAQSGFVVFPRPVIIPAVDYAILMPVSAVLWTVDEIESADGPRQGLTFSSYVWKGHYGYGPDMEDAIAARMGMSHLPKPHIYMERHGNENIEITAEQMWARVVAEVFDTDEWVGIGRNDWFFGTAADDMDDSMTVATANDAEQALVHISRDRTLFWTLNKLLTAERHTERTVRQPSKKSSKKRKATVGDDEVHIIHLRKNAPSKPTLNPGSGRKLAHESKTTGHYKMQAYGPGRSLRRRIFVHEYERGKGLPPKENVYSLDR